MNLADIIFDAVYPRKCAFCGKLLKFSVHQRDYDLCENCLEYAETEYDGGDIMYAFEYLGNIRKCILDFKFNDSYVYGKTIARFIYDIIKDTDFDIITAVPSHSRQIIKRGYDHTKIICQYLCEYTGKPYIKLIKRIKNSKPQKDCSYEERKENVRDAFRVSDYDINGKTILLVDDVCTTGSTLRECEKILKQKQAKSVIKAVMAIHHKYSP